MAGKLVWTLNGGLTTTTVEKEYRKPQRTVWDAYARAEIEAVYQTGWLFDGTTAYPLHRIKKVDVQWT